MKKLTFSVILLALFSTSALAQKAKTPYEKTKEELRAKLFNNLGIPEYLIGSTSNVGSFFDVLMDKARDNNGMALLVKYQQDLQAAESLKTLNEKSPIGQEDIIMISTADERAKQYVTVTDDDQPLNFVSMENPPTYPGGIEKFYKFIEDNKKYPALAVENNIQGSVFVSFIIEKDGSLTSIRVVRKLGHGTDEEAVRVLKMSKRWNPGMQNGKPVRVKYNIPVKFTLP